MGDNGPAVDANGQVKGQASPPASPAIPLQAEEVDGSVQPNEALGLGAGRSGPIDEPIPAQPIPPVPNDDAAPNGYNEALANILDENAGGPAYAQNNPGNQADDAVELPPQNPEERAGPEGAERNSPEDAPATRRRKTEAEKKAAKPELSRDVPEDQWVSDIALANIAKPPAPYERHKAAPYAFNYRGVLQSKFRDRILELRGRERQPYLSVPKLKRIIDNYPA